MQILGPGSGLGSGGSSRGALVVSVDTDVLTQVVGSGKALAAIFVGTAIGYNGENEYDALIT